METVRCEVLNSTYEPLNTVPIKRALKLCAKGKAKVLTAHPSYVIFTSGDEYPLPLQILLFEYVKPKTKSKTNAILTPHNLRVRDKFTCQYCGRHKSELKQREDLTRDHVHPQAKGGGDVWTNVVLACSSCNNKKADYTAEEFERKTGFKLRRKAYAPTVFELQSKAKLNYHKMKCDLT
jgi:5-methylcytosine-specific restriction endonuclease McrA